MKWHYLIMVLILVGCTKPEVIRIAFENSDAVISAEIAESAEELRFGLMNRTSLESNSGMLFVFPNSQPRAFWMKNTLIPLDMVFIDEDKRVVTIQKAIPCTEDPCPTYPTDKPARYVLELNQHYTDSNNIKNGTKVYFELPN